jgi:hypothetical protein
MNYSVSNENMSSGTPNDHENMSSRTHSAQGRTSSGTLADFWGGRRWVEGPFITQTSGSVLGDTVSASSSVEDTSSSNQEMGLTQPDLNRNDWLTGAANAGNPSRTQDRNIVSEDRQPTPTGVIFPGQLQPALQSL